MAKRIFFFRFEVQAISGLHCDRMWAMPDQRRQLSSQHVDRLWKLIEARPTRVTRGSFGTVRCAPEISPQVGIHGVEPERGERIAEIFGSAQNLAAPDGMRNSRSAIVKDDAHVDLVL